MNGDAKLAEAKAAAKQNLGTLNHITNAQRIRPNNAKSIKRRLFFMGLYCKNKCQYIRPRNE
ncbi:hypothetical protein ACVNPX_02240 [Staphylococcus aureus]